MMRFWNLFIFLLVGCVSLHAQNYTGVWRGTFTAGLGAEASQCDYEIQIIKTHANKLEGIAYTSRNNTLLAKTTLTGKILSNGRIRFNEKKLLLAQGIDATQLSLMFCQVKYFKIQHKEILEGYFTSKQIRNNENGVSGSLVLSKVKNSAFYKEPFLAKK